MPASFVNSYERCKSVEEIDKLTDYILPCHDEVANARLDLFSYTITLVRKHCRRMSGYKVYFSDMPIGTADKEATALTGKEFERYTSRLTDPKDMAEY